MSYQAPIVLMTNSVKFLNNGFGHSSLRFPGGNINFPFEFLSFIYDGKFLWLPSLYKGEHIDRKGLLVGFSANVSYAGIEDGIHQFAVASYLRDRAILNGTECFHLGSSLVEKIFATDGKSELIHEKIESPGYLIL